MKTAIVYYSKHHGNTKKLIDAIVKAYPDVVAIDAIAEKDIDVSSYECVGFASGIYGANFAPALIKLAPDLVKKGQKVFFLYTSSLNKESFTNSIRKAIEPTGAEIIGGYGCRGYDTFGPFKLVGGIGKEHPTAEEIQGAVDYFKSIAE